MSKSAQQKISSLQSFSARIFLQTALHENSIIVKLLLISTNTSFNIKQFPFGLLIFLIKKMHTKH